MYLKDMNELPTVDFSTLELSTEQEKFCQEFSYAPMENPLETIREIFNSWFAQQRRRFQREPIPYICDFSRCRLNVRLTACIQPLLRGHKYRVSALFGSCLLAAHANSEFILRKIWGRLQTVVTLQGVGILICHYNNSLCVNPTGFYSPNILYLLSSFSNPPTDFSSCQQAELLKLNKAYLWPRSKVWMWAL